MTRTWIDPNRSEFEFAPVHCAGCGRQLGIAPSYRRVFRVVYCDDFCWLNPPIPEIENAARDRYVCALSTYAGLTQHKLAEVFDISRSRVSQVLAGGNEKDTRHTGSSDAVRETKSRGGKAAAAKRYANSQE